MKSLVLCVVMAVAVAAINSPQQEGAAYTKEAIKQAQNTYLIPKDAVIQAVCNLIIIYMTCCGNILKVKMLPHLLNVMSYKLYSDHFIIK